jgi:UDP-2,4-diacetamido-2,4,6-trideoxy-beta-L-altropyranose hydrolase
MHVVFRTDASVVMGQGHVMRCLTLASALRTQGIKSTFVCREYPGNLCDFIENGGFAVCRLPMGNVSAASGPTLKHNAWRSPIRWKSIRIMFVQIVYKKSTPLVVLI